MEAMLRSILDEILESKLTAILSSILDVKLKAYEESMTFFNTSFETMKVKMDRLEKQTKTLAQENDRLRSDSASSEALKPPISCPRIQCGYRVS